MPCDMRYALDILPEKLAEQGWNPDEIDLLEKEIELARRKAEAESYQKRSTFAEQQRSMDEAEQKARENAHERMHAKLRDGMEEIRKMKDAKEIPVPHGHGHGHGGDRDASDDS